MKYLKMTLEDGLEKHLSNFIEQHKDMKLIVIDTFQLARGANRESNYPNDDYIRNNPSDGVLKELKQSHIFKTEKRRGLTKPEQELLLSFLKNHSQYMHWYPMFAVLVGTGLRIGESAGLRWCHRLHQNVHQWKHDICMMM